MAAVKLSKKISNLDTTTFGLESFKNVILQHLDILMSRKENSSIDLTQQEADKWYGDFHGLLQTRGVRPHLYWIITVMNGLNCSTDYDSDFTVIVTPDTEYLDKLMDIHNTIHR